METLFFAATGLQKNEPQFLFTYSWHAHAHIVYLKNNIVCKRITTHLVLGIRAITLKALNVLRTSTLPQPLS